MYYCKNILVQWFYNLYSKQPKRLASPITNREKFFNINLYNTRCTHHVHVYTCTCIIHIHTVHVYTCVYVL